MGNDFHQIQFCVLGCLYCLIYRDYSHLFTIRADESDFGCGDVTIQAVSFILFGDSKFPLSNFLCMFAVQHYVASPGAVTEQGKPIITSVLRRYADVRRIHPGS